MTLSPSSSSALLSLLSGNDTAASRCRCPMTPHHRTTAPLPPPFFFSLSTLSPWRTLANFFNFLKFFFPFCSYLSSRGGDLHRSDRANRHASSVEDPRAQLGWKGGRGIDLYYLNQLHRECRGQSELWRDSSTRLLIIWIETVVVPKVEEARGSGKASSALLPLSFSSSSSLFPSPVLPTWCRSGCTSAFSFFFFLC